MLGTFKLTLGQERGLLEAKLVVLVTHKCEVWFCWDRGWSLLPGAAGIWLPAQVAMVAFGLLVVQKV